MEFVRDVDDRLGQIEERMAAVKHETISLKTDLMKQDSDIFAPCLKLKNKVVLRTELNCRATKILKASGLAPTETKLKELI